MLSPSSPGHQSDTASMEFQASIRVSVNARCLRELGLEIEDVIDGMTEIGLAERISRLRL